MPIGTGQAACMHGWTITAVRMCSALLVWNVCSSMLLRVEQAISVKTICARDARDKASRLEQRQTERRNQQRRLRVNIKRLRKNTMELGGQLATRGRNVRDPGFALCTKPHPSRTRAPRARRDSGPHTA